VSERIAPLLDAREPAEGENLLFYTVCAVHRLTPRAPRLDRPEVDDDLRALAARIAVNLRNEHATVTSLCNDEPDAWSELGGLLASTAAQRNAEAATRPALVDIRRRLLAQTPRADAAGAREGEVCPQGSYIFVTPFADWARSILLAPVIDEEIRLARSARGDLAAPDRERIEAARHGLHAAIDVLPEIQRTALLRGLWRDDQDPDQLAALERIAPHQRPAPAQSVNGRLEAANRSVARRKLARRSPLWSVLLDELLPRKSRYAAANEPSRACTAEPVVTLLPSLVESSDGVAPSWREVRDHVESCLRCTAVVMGIRDRPEPVDVSSVDVSELKRDAIRAALESGDELEQVRAIDALTGDEADPTEISLLAHVASRSETAVPQEKALEQLLQLESTRSLSDRLADAWKEAATTRDGDRLFAALSRLEVAGRPAWLHPTRLEVNLLDGSERAVVTGAGGVSGRIERRNGALQLVLHALPAELARRPLRIAFPKALGTLSDSVHWRADDAPGLVSVGPIDGSVSRIDLGLIREGRNLHPAEVGDGFLFLGPTDGVAAKGAIDRLANSARGLLRRGDYRRALLAAQEAKAMAEYFAFRVPQVQALLVDILEAIGRPLNAASVGQLALKSDPRPDDDADRARVAARVARASARGANFDPALRANYRKEARRLLASAASIERTGDLQDSLLVASAYAVLGRTREGITLLETACDTLADGSEELALARLMLAELLLDALPATAARKELARVRELIDREPDEMSSAIAMRRTELADREVRESELRRSRTEAIDRHEGEPRGALQPLAAEALRLAREEDDRRGELAALRVLGRYDRVEGRDHLGRALVLARRMSDDDAEFELLVEIAQRERGRGDLNEALIRLDEALVRSDRRGDRIGRARALMLSGRVQRDLGRYRDAEGTLTEAREILESAVMERGAARSDILYYSDVLEDLGRVKRARGLMSDAYDLMCEAHEVTQDRLTGLYRARRVAKLHSAVARILLDYKPPHSRAKLGDDAGKVALGAVGLLKRVGDRRGYGKALRTLGRARHNTGDLREALRSLTSAGEVLSQLHDASGEAEVQNDIGGLYRDMGEPEKALEACEGALALAPVSDRSLRLKIHNNRGGIFRHTGRYAEADADFHRALRLATQLDSRVGRALAISNLAGLHRDRGKHQRALELHWEALARQRKVGDRRREGHTLNSIANVLNDLGRFAEAHGFLEHALEIARDIGDRRGEAKANNNLAHLQRHLGGLAAAIDGSEQALGVFRAEDATRDIAVALNDLAMARLNLWLTEPEDRRASLETALDECGEALAQCTKIKDEAGRGRSLHAKGRVLLARGEPEAARASLDQALAIREELEDERRAVSTLFALARVHEHVDDPATARRLYERAEENHEELRRSLVSVDLRISYMALAAHIYRHDVMSLAHHDPTAAIVRLERSRARGLLDRIAGAETESSADSRLAELASLRWNGREPGRPADPPEHILELDRMLATRRDRGRVRDPVAGKTYDFESIRSELLSERDDTVLLEYMLDDSGGLLLAATRDGVRSVELPPAVEIESRVTELRAAVRNALHRYPHGRWLYRTLIEPVEDLLEGRDNLLVVGDGALERLPFGLLLTAGDDEEDAPLVANDPPRPGLELETATDFVDRLAAALSPEAADWAALPYLLRRVGIVHLPSASAAVAIRRRALERDEPSHIYAGSLLAVYPTTQPAPRERPALLARLADLKVLSGEEATKSVVRRTATGRGGYRALLIASDATVDYEKPEFSRIRLSGTGEDACWGHYEVARMRLPHELVLLCAPHSALGPSFPGEGAIGLPHAFLAAGASSVVGLLWERTDAVEELMIRMYASVRSVRRGGGVAAALQGVQLRALAAERHLHPVFWAGLVTFGSPA
jgi:tetratricopeptide (TPR) repeat protein